MRRAVREALVLAVFTTVLTGGVGAARADDCWLLDAPALERAQSEGRCADVFARSAPSVKPAPAKPTPSRPAKTARRAPAKAKPQTSVAESLERLFQLKPDPGSAGRRRGGSIDHLAYGRTDANPVQR